MTNFGHTTLKEQPNYSHVFESLLLTAKLSQGLNLLDADIPGIYSNGLTTATIKLKINKTTPVGPDIKNKTFASWQNILAVKPYTELTN